MKYKITFINNESKKCETTLVTNKNEIFSSLYDLLCYADEIKWKILWDIEIIKK